MAPFADLLVIHAPAATHEQVEAFLEQVRRPIYSSSVNLWRRYEAELQELIEVLAPVLERLPASDRLRTPMERLNDGAFLVDDRPDAKATRCMTGCK